MAEEKATATAQTPASESAQATVTATADAKTFTQSDVDRAVRQALKTREEHLSAEKQAALKKAEQDGQIARGEFDTVRKQLEAELSAARSEAQGVRVSHELKVAALQAGINDPDDVRLLAPDVLAGLTDDKGAINRDAVAKAIESLKSSKGYLFKSSVAAPPAFAGAASAASAVPPAAPADLTAEAWYRARQAQSERVRNVTAPSGTDLLATLIKRK